MIPREHIPLLVVVSAPSGAGKTTLCHRLLAEFDSMTYSVSCTTRAPRPGEVDGQDYYFLSDDEFDQRLKQGAFLESAYVHGYRYGTLKDAVLMALQAGKDVLMDLDVQGASQVREALKSVPPDTLLQRAYVDVFIVPPSMEVLAKRLYDRGKDHKEVIDGRLKMAEQEISRWLEYHYLIVNDQLDASYDVLRSIIVAEHHRVDR